LYNYFNARADTKETKMTIEKISDTLNDISDVLDRKLDSKNSFGEYTGDILNSINFHLERIADSLEKITNK
jgi:archaellum component FlaC